ncbi:MAG: hypothetical protein GQ583_07240 [Methyloprofundus sp.]|nr:hypothetical protein [Methyloprofundus sp.]
MISLKTHALLNQFQRFIKKAHFVKQYDKRDESDRKMLQRVGRKFGVLFFVILMFDTLLDWFLGIIDIAIHLIHLIIELIEYSFLILLAQLFNFDQQQSEMIIVNATIIIALSLAYRLIPALPGLTLRVKQYLLSAWLRYIKRKSSCWQTMSLSHKIKCFSAYSCGAICLLFFL